MATEFTDFELNDPELEALAMTLRENRPAPDPEFTERLDTAVSDHFPKEWSSSQEETKELGAFRRVRRWLGESRSYLLPLNAGIAGLTVVVIAVGIAISGGESAPNDPMVATTESTSDFGSINQPEIIASGNESYDASAQDMDAPQLEWQDRVRPAPRSRTYTSAGITLGAGGFSDSTGPYAAGADSRKVAQEAEITLGTKPENVQEVSNDVIEVVDDHNGIVLDSSVVDGPAGKAGAKFSLMIPSAQLESAIAELSGIADLRARNQETEDITAPTLTVEDSLQTARARVESLVNELASATTDEDRARIEDELGQERRQVARITTRLNNLERRANLTPVAVKVETGGDTSSADDSSWGIGDALDDAAKMLTVSAGVALVALAVAIPIGLMVLLALALNRAWVRRSRRRALDEN